MVRSPRLRQVSANPQGAPRWLWPALLAALVLAKAQALRDPHYWDSLGCYVAQARFMFQHGLDLPAYRALSFVRPPLYTGLLALVMHVSRDRLALHLFTCLFGACLLPAVYAITRALAPAGRRGPALVAAVLCALSPLFFAQAGLCQSDLPATVFLAWAWALLLRAQPQEAARTARVKGAVILLCLAVLTKESAYFLCGPAALLELLRSRRLVSVVPFGIPCAVLLGWELLHRHVLGYIMPPVYHAAIAPRFLGDALLHNFLEGGRFALLVPAGLYVRAVYRDRGAPQRREVLLTALAVAALPVCFPAPLPRYMLPTLPLLCALAALGLGGLGRWRGPATLALGAVLLASMNAAGWDSQGGHHLDQSLAYRTVLSAERAAAEALAEARPRRVLATFPMYTVLTAPPEDGYLAAPLVATVPLGGEPLAVLCDHDYVVEAAQGNELDQALRTLREAGALRGWRRFGALGQDVTVWSIACPK